MSSSAVTSAGRSQASRIVNELRRAIVACEYAPGDRLHIASLASSFDASPGAVREALSRLAGEHLVIAIEQRGFRVSDLSIDDMLDLYSTRAMLEQRMASESVKSGGAEWRKALTECHERLQRFGPNTLISNDVIEAHEDYHRQLLAACPSHWLKRLHETLYRASERYRFYMYQYLAGQRNVMGEHAAIYEAAIAGDHELTGLLVRRHVEQTRDLLASGLENRVSEDLAVKAV
ncbi:GntR family transcriptional regulator [Novosphingobium album (ex Hu et al. 2023)]|uniref:GntR family transcriptional regulator n=1 Tax=Novosphingobium album (ex Hu et al. 2023) TaxID=2930093 RepID=A0ABT0B6S1_9SPHN|nr:GntR family transcriptional regulator [Novosphingobium album (ex Hu et al. 2023)]MCJ2180746.1 GntR family transcriptional regulator [Novosphingobium album (ex Hu et al. 2023)]